jgi:predicted DNA-binding transcriptional regulator AlpA
MNEDSITGNAVSIREVAQFFGVSVRTIREWMTRDPGFPKPFKKFGTLRFRLSEIQAYWKENRREETEL